MSGESSTWEAKKWHIESICVRERGLRTHHRLGWFSGGFCVDQTLPKFLGYMLFARVSNLMKVCSTWGEEVFF
ncbi:hypothetical protein RIF29_29220 [Crotalaria pallida]|uniref:Uncharacterized protein n=1 Tax=Crotalaria pallida TaxID=3830 RepID=A0AAN9EF34_CROPI